MSKHIIHIYGASGAGTTTLGSYIQEKLGYAQLDSDDYFWLPTDPMFTTKREPAQRIALMKKEMERTDHIVISGSLVDWGDELIPLFTFCIRLETETGIRMERLKAREKKRFGSRIGPGGDMYQEHLAFLAWAARYDTGGPDMRSRAMHDAWQKRLLCKQIVLNGADSPARNLALIQRAQNDSGAERN